MLGLPGPEGEGGTGPRYTAISKHSLTQIDLGLTRKINSGTCDVQG